MYCIRFTWKKTDVCEPLNEWSNRRHGTEAFCVSLNVLFKESLFLCIVTFCRLSQAIQFTHTFDFFESVMRYFSYCSMLKIKLGMAFAYQEKKERTNLLGTDLFEGQMFLVVQFINAFLLVK